MASGLLFGWIAQYMYAGDAPLAERRAAALSLNRELLRDLLGAEELRELLDPDVLAQLEAELQRTAETWRATHVDGIEDLLRWLGPLTVPEVGARVTGVDARDGLATLHDQRRIIEIGFRGERCYASAEDAARLRDALGVALPAGLPAAFTDPVAHPLVDLVSRYARTHGPFLTSELSRALAVEPDRAETALAELERQGRLVRGEFRPDGHEREWCHTEVLRVLRRRSLAALRSEVEPVDGEVLARFQGSWQHVGSRLTGVDGLAEVLTALQGAALPASILESEILPARLRDYNPADLDTLLSAGEVVWAGAGSLGVGDGRVRLVFRDQAPLLIPEGDGPPTAEVHEVLRTFLTRRGAVFWNDLVAAVQEAGVDYSEQSVLTGLWDLVWAGELTNDAFTPLRAVLGGAVAKGRSSHRRAGRRPSMRSLNRMGPPAGTGRWSLVEPLRRPIPTPTEIATTRALQLLERYGVLTREMALAEGVEGGFAGVYPILKELEDRGQVRRGYFVAGLGAAQFALPGAVDRLRDLRKDGAGADDGETDDWRVLASADPAQPYGAALRWPDTEGRPSRAVGSYVVLRGGLPVVFLERGGRSVVTFDIGEDRLWVQELAGLVKAGRIRSIEVQKIDGRPSAEVPSVRDMLLEGGFAVGYRGPTLRR
jgi:ATP-dependent Lhr-like helicase